MNPLYTAEATVRGGRQGRVRSSDGIVDFDLKMPKEVGGPGGVGTNPEQLFAAGYAACFESAMRAVARKSHHELTDASVTAVVTLNSAEDHGWVLSVELRALIPGMAHDDIHALMEQAHQVCPYSKATRGNIDVRLVAENAESPVVSAATVG